MFIHKCFFNGKFRNVFHQLLKERKRKRFPQAQGSAYSFSQRSLELDVIHCLVLYIIFPSWLIQASFGSNGKVVFFYRKVTDSSRGNSLSAKNKEKTAYDKRPSPNPRKVGSLMHRDCLYYVVMDPEAARTARESLNLAFHLSNILDTGLDRHTFSVLIALFDLGLNPEALAAVVKELQREPPPANFFITNTLARFLFLVFSSRLRSNIKEVSV